jgi:hypothetical protein
MVNSSVALDRFLHLHGVLAGGEYYLKLFKSKLSSAFLKLVAAIIVWPIIPKSAKELGFQKKKPFPVGKGYLPSLNLRQG